jgi:hypothetical protein
MNKTGYRKRPLKAYQYEKFGTEIFSFSKILLFDMGNNIGLPVNGPLPFIQPGVFLSS